MSNRARYVFDTNTLVSALLFEHSRPDKALRQALQQGVLLLSSATLEELADVMRREKFDRYVTVSERETFLEALVFRAMLIEPDVKIRACRDPKDDKFLELAMAGAARCIVTGDADLLILHPFRGLSIVTPAAFLEVIRS